MKLSPLLALLVIAPLNMGWGFFIDTPVFAPQTLSGVGAIGEITSTGSITTAGADAVIMEDDEQTVLNQGAIITAGFDAVGIYNGGGENSTIESSGTIATAGVDSHGIYNDGGSAVSITNSGTVATAGLTASGILNENGSGSTITNIGSIDTIGLNAHGIENSASENSTIINSSGASIATLGIQSHGVSNEFSANSSITNIGSIETVGFDAYGIQNLNSAGSFITNGESGTIETEGDEAHGIYNQNSSGVSIESSGLIETVGELAIGIYNQNSLNTTITNLSSGSILTADDIAYGIWNASSGGSLIENRGSIETEGSYAHGILNQNSMDVYLENSGTIQTRGDFARGVLNLFSPQAVITNSGLIQTFDQNAHGIFNLSSAEATILNSGVIQTFEGFSIGVCSDESNASEITNEGFIETAGIDAHGIFNQFSENAIVTNQGTIQTSGVGAKGIFNTSSQGSIIINSSFESIVTTGDGAHGIHNLNSSDVTITNTGLISTAGNTAHGIFNEESENVLITNSGLIQTSGEGSHAIFNENSAELSIFNSGHLLAQGENSDAIQSFGVNLEVTNGGTIESQQGFALNLFGANPTLTSLPCSKIIGPVQSEDLLNFNVPTPFNMILTLTDDSAGFGELSINAPFVQMGNTIAVLDTSAFTATADIVADLSDTLLNSLSNSCYDCFSPDGTSLWLKGIGSYRSPVLLLLERSSGSERLRYYRQGGFLAGVTTSCFGGAPLSLFGGAVYGRARPSGNGCNGSGDLNTTSYVGGFSYERPFCGGCIMLAAHAGNLKIDHKRTVFDNLAPNGVFETKGKSSGFFVTPEASFRHRFALQNRPVAMTAALRYAGFFPGDYRESFSNQQVKIDKHGMSLLTARLLLGLPFSCALGVNCLNVEPYLGGAGRFQLSSRSYSGTFFNESIFFTSSLSRNIASFLYGLKACYKACNSDFYASFEGDFENEKSQRYIGSAGIAYRF